MPSLSDKIQFYRTLTTFEGTEMSLSRALSQKSIGPLYKISHRLSRQLQEHGDTLSEAMSRLAPDIFTSLEVNLVQLGEKTGSLESVFRSLAEWFAFTQRIKRQMISNLLYPIFLYHVAVLAFGVAGYFMGKLSSPAHLMIYASVLLGCPYAVLFAYLLFPRRRQQSPGLFKTFVAHVVLALPLFGGVAHKLNCTRFFHAFALSQQAGLGAVQAVRLSAGACTNPLIRAKFEHVAEMMEKEGCPFSEAFKAHASPRDQQSTIFGLIETGDFSGRTEEMSAHVASTCEAEVEESLKRIAKIVPLLLYLTLAGAIAYFIIQFYLDLFSRSGLIS